MFYLASSKKYRKSLKKLLKSGNFNLKKLNIVINTLVQGKKLEPHFLDHQLSGDMEKYRECHVENNLLLLYKIEMNILTLTLIDIGSHSQLF